MRGLRPFVTALALAWVLPPLALGVPEARAGVSQRPLGPQIELDQAQARAVVSSRAEILEAWRERLQAAERRSNELARAAVQAEAGLVATRAAALSAGARRERVRRKVDALRIEARSLERRLEQPMRRLVASSREAGNDVKGLAQLRAMTRLLVSRLADTEAELELALAEQGRFERAARAATLAYAASVAGRGGVEERLAAERSKAEQARLHATVALRRHKAGQNWLAALGREDDRRAQAAAWRPSNLASAGWSSLQPASLRSPLPREPMALHAVAQPTLAPFSLQRRWDWEEPGLAAYSPQAKAATASLPVDGQVAKTFGERLRGGLDRGIAIDTFASAQVRTPKPGTVAFAGTFRRLGLLLIIDHGEEYHTLLTGMSGLAVEKGDRVDAGQPVGVMPQGWRVAAGVVPRLYMELRHKGHPINPLPWLASGQGKVSG